MDDFSFFDRLRACLPCTRPPRLESDDEGDLNTRDELDRLLFDSEHEPTDIEADAMSLHSNIGSGRRRKKKKRGMGKSVRVFGFDLFGRPRAHTPSPPNSDDETSALQRTLRPPPRHNPQQSTSTLDSDAAPLNDSAIATLSQDPSKWAPELTDAQLALEEDEQREKEERKARRAARRLRRREEADAEAEAIADQAAGFGPVPLPDPGEFEGFPGKARLAGPDQSISSSHPDDEFGPYVTVKPGGPEDHSPEDSDEADVGGEYNRRSKHSTYSGSGGGSSSRSHSRANGSATRNSPEDSGNRHHGSRRKVLNSGLNLLQQQQTPYSVPLPPSSAGSRHSFDFEHGQGEVAPRPKKKKKKPTNSRSSTSTSQSPSLPSPQNESFAQPHVLIQDASATHSLQEVISVVPDFPSPGLPSTGFPSTGFGGARVKRTGSLAGQGAALASRGM